MAAPPAALFPPMQMPPLPIRSPSPPPHFPIPGPRDSVRRLPKPLPDFDFDWAVPTTRFSPPGPPRLRPLSWAEDDEDPIKFHARQNSGGSSAASTPTAPSPSYLRWPSSAGSVVSSSSRPSYEHDRPAATPPNWLSGADSSPPPRRKPYFAPSHHHQPRSPEMGTTAPYPEPPIGAAPSSFRDPHVVIDDAPRGTGGARAERATRKRADKDGISDIICEIDAALDRIGGARAAALNNPSPLPSPGTPVRSEFGSRFKVRQESPLRHGRSVTMPENLGVVQGEGENPGGAGGSLATPTTKFHAREPHSPTTSSPLKGKPKRGAPLVGPPPVTARARYRPVSNFVVAHASSVAAPKTTFPAPGLPANSGNVNNGGGGKPTANSSVIRTAVAPNPSTALHSNPPCSNNKRRTMPPGALLSSGTTRSVSSGTTLVSNGSGAALEHGNGNAANGRSFSSPLGNIAAAASSTPALHCSPSTPPTPPVHRDPLDASAYRQQQGSSRPRALSTSSSPSISASPLPSPSPYACANATTTSTSLSTSTSTSNPTSSHTASTELFSLHSSPNSSRSRSRSPSRSPSSSHSSTSSHRGRQLRRKFSPRRASLRELRDKHSDACLKQAFEWGVQRYLEGTIFWDGKEADLFLGPDEGVVGDEWRNLDCEDGERGRGRGRLRESVGGEQWSECREWSLTYHNGSSGEDVWHDAASMDVGVGVAFGDPHVDHDAAAAAAAALAYGFDYEYGCQNQQRYDDKYGFECEGFEGANGNGGGFGFGDANEGFGNGNLYGQETESEGLALGGGFGSGSARGWAEEVLGAAIG
ncbi:hypothetical protein IWX50DRAFT_695262 [Phyllosticta citricarpa]|uniref:Uncharacterized protein n=2 Tax=Phyllosticta TaxID=121621 RepID=A0ABR1MM59_9PEZI